MTEEGHGERKGLAEGVRRTGGGFLAGPDVTLDSLYWASTRPPSNTGVDLYRGPAIVLWEATGKSERLRFRLSL
jgi:hypothetical protein